MLHNALSPMKVKHLESGKFADGRGLWLQKRSKIAGKWFLRIVIEGRRREMGLGSWPDVSIAEARERAKRARRSVRDGLDPIEERNKIKFRPKRLTVAEAIQECFEARRAELKNNGQSGRWLSPLRLHIIPKIGDLPIEDVDQHVLCDVFRPLWHSKPDTARKAMNRINLTLKHAAALDLDVDLQAVMKMQALLGKRKHEVKHIPSMPYADAPKFYRELCAYEFTSAVALRFLMLTVARTSEIRLATYDEIDGDIWTLQPERTKTNKEYRIPLSGEALRIVNFTREYNDTEFLFPSANGKPLSDVAMTVFMKREGYEARPHGFRATFRTWAENETDADWETKEMALGHRVGNAVERAYQRSDLIDKRRKLLIKWSKYLKE